MLARSGTGPRNFYARRCRILNGKQEVLMLRRGAQGIGRTLLHLFCSPVLAGGEWMCESPGDGCQGTRVEKNNRNKDGCDCSLQTTSILMGKQHILSNSEAELLTLRSCRRLTRPRFQNDARLRVGAEYEGIYGLSVLCVCLCQSESVHNWPRHCKLFSDVEGFTLTLRVAFLKQCLSCRDGCLIHYAFKQRQLKRQ